MLRSTRLAGVAARGASGLVFEILEMPYDLLVEPQVPLRQLIALPFATTPSTLPVARDIAARMPTARSFGRGGTPRRSRMPALSRVRRAPIAVSVRCRGAGNRLCASRSCKVN